MKKLKTVAFILLALTAGFVLRGYFSPSPEPPPPQPDAQSLTPKASIYTCSMHPQFQLPKPGKCPICFMDLIPLEAGDGEEGGEREIRVSPYAAKLMEIETTEAIRAFKPVELRLFGTVDYDETRLTTIAARFPGRIERLFIDFTGVAVKAGEALAELYSPELLTAQSELLQADKQTLDAAREKLRLWGVTTEQISAIEQRGSVAERMTIHSPADGIVIHRNAQEGAYVQTGAPLYTIADLSTVWLQLDAYESDLRHIRIGDPVTFTLETFPGKTFKGSVEFISPTINPATRTANIRVAAANPEQAIKPGMFARAVLKPQTAEEGDPPLVIPVTAALKTGKRAVVYIEVPNRDKPTYEGREVMLGERRGDFYVVASGLEAGERVVTRGAFKLDAELQIHAKPSMMSMESEEQGTGSGEMRPQTLCPVMGGKINKEVYTDYNGMRIYFCCGGCDGTFLENPEKFIEQMRAAGVEPEHLKDE